ncbi:MAG: beta-N-acetylhexosaminidase [Paramuribaculum sp.]|nr:beta-N-acetylhexosaminidase [Paramuribaculum sp.]
MKISAFFAMVGLAALACSCTQTSQVADYNVVPLPKSIEYQSSEAPFVLSGSTVIVAQDESLQDAAELLSGYITQATGIKTKVSDSADNAASVILLKSAGEEFAHNDPASEAYTITVTPSQIVIEGVTPEATLRGIQTLRKSIAPVKSGSVEFAAVTINDQPEFGHRGAMFDVSRHFFPADSVIKFLDMMALHNLNRFHWHITDDQGWRLPIKGRPELTEKGAYRKETVIGHNTGEYDGKPYTGSYTPEDIVRVREHAKKLGIEIIPEVDLPGHMLAALATYPELGCTGGPYEVWGMWGVSDDVLCAGNPKTYEFIDDILTQLIEMFPESPYIHVGGDECPKVRWEKCEKCQAKIAELGLKSDEHASAEMRLQSHVIMFADSVIRSHGRHTIGWNEILEGGIDTTATIHAWTGENAGVEAARKGHQVVMSPTSHLYFDYYQSSDIENEPEAIGGYVPVRKVYEYYPVPKGLTPEEEKKIVGVQANLWTEYIPEYSQVEYMELPRMAALAETGWGKTANATYNDFLTRVDRLAAHYRNNNYNYAKHVWGVDGTLTTDSAARKVTLTLFTPDNVPLKYSTTGKDGEYKPYEGPVEIDRTSVIYATTGIEGRKDYTDSMTVTKSSFLPVELKYAPHPRYAGHGASTLTDSRYGSRQYNDGAWLGFISTPLVATIPFPQTEEVSEVSLRTCVVTGDWIMDAETIEVEALGADNKWQTVATLTPVQPTEHVQKISTHTLTFSPVQANALRVTVTPAAALPEWHGGAGRPAFVMVDEISVN